MKIVFCWSDISGYMAACWRELVLRPGVDLHVFAYGNSHQTAFGHELMEGVPWTPLDETQRNDAVFVGQAVAGLQPDVVVLAGWLNPAYVSLTRDPRLGQVKFIMGMDTPWRDTLRQRLARFALRKYLARLSAIFVPGERAWQFARRLGFPAERIHRGMYGVDWEGFAKVGSDRLGALTCPQRGENVNEDEHETPKRSVPTSECGNACKVGRPGPSSRIFLFVGRYEGMKGVDVLIDAYRLYRQQNAKPWNLHFCGMGTLASRLQDQPGIKDHGFCQPEEIRQHMTEASALVLPSRYDPWPLIVVEAAAAGLPLLVSEACGSTVEVLRPMFNGLTVSPYASAQELAAVMTRLAARNDLDTWGARSRMLAEPYSASSWADRWLAVIRRLLE